MKSGLKILPTGPKMKNRKLPCIQVQDTFWEIKTLNVNHIQL